MDRWSKTCSKRRRLPALSTAKWTCRLKRKRSGMPAVQGASFANWPQFLRNFQALMLPDSAAPTSFIEMGFDSLFLTQVTQALQKKFAVKITFRQLPGRSGDA